jgi:hypothetical protein
VIVIAIAIARDLRVITAEFHCHIYSSFVPVPSSIPLKESTAVVGTLFPLFHQDLLFHHHQLLVYGSIVVSPRRAWTTANIVVLFPAPSTIELTLS